MSVLFSNLFYYDRRDRRCRCCCCCCRIIYSFSPLCSLSNILLLYRVPHRLQYHNVQVKRNIIIIVLRKNMEVKEYVKRVKVSLVNLAKLNRLSDLAPNKRVSIRISNHLITVSIFA